MKKFILDQDINFLFWLPNIIGLVFLLLPVLIGKLGYLNLRLNWLFLAFTSFCFGVSGIPMIIKQECPRNIIHLSKRIALISGIQIAIFGFMAFLFFLYSAINGKL